MGFPSLGDIFNPFGSSDPTIKRGLALIPGVGSYIGQEDTNSANMALADKQMAFQERMSSSAHTREVADLRNAGLNPILSANAGASSPSGASIAMQNPAAGVGEAFTGMFNTLTQIQKMGSEMGLNSALTSKAAADAGKSVQDTKTSAAQEQEILSTLGVKRDQADWDRKMMQFDNVLKRIRESVETGAAGVKMMPSLDKFMGGLGKGGSNKNPTGYVPLPQF